jgi:hypothetical protein
MLYLLGLPHDRTHAEPYVSYYLRNESNIPEGYSSFTLALVSHDNLLDDQNQRRRFTEPIIVDLEEGDVAKAFR